MTDEYASPKKRAETADRGFGKTAILIPEQFKTIKIEKAGKRFFDFLPYIAGAGNPFADKGQKTDERTYYVHRGIGVNEQPYLCLAKNFNQPCPPCEHASRLRKTGDETDKKLAQDLRPRRRQLFALRDKDEPEAGIQIWDYSYPLFGEILEERIKAGDADDGFEDYFKLVGGSTLRILFKEEYMGQNKFYTASSIDFKRRNDVPPKVLEKVPCLDDFLVRVTYEELYAIYYQEEFNPDVPREDSRGSGGGSKGKPAGDDDWGDDKPKSEDKPKRGRKPKETTTEADTTPEKTTPEEAPKGKPKDDDDWEDDKPAGGSKPKSEESAKKKPEPAADDDWED